MANTPQASGAGSTAVSTQTQSKSPLAMIADQLDQLRPQLQQSLPAHIKVDLFKRATLTAINLNPSLVKLERRSLFNALLKCASDGLIPDGREAALVPYGQQAQYMPMVFGIIKKLRQSGEIASISSRMVYQNEIDSGRFTFKIIDGQEVLHHEPILVGERGAPALVYAAARFKDGTVQYEPLTMGDIDKIRKASKNANRGPWVDWFEEMCRKSAVRRLSKYLPLSAEDRRLIDREDEPTEFDEMKQAAVDSSQAQSIEAAALLLGAGGDEEATTAEQGT